MGVTPEAKPVASGDHSSLITNSLPSSSRELPASLAKAGIIISPDNCTELDAPSFHPARGMGSSSLLAITGTSTITLKGNNTTTKIEGDGVTVGESIPSHAESWPALKIISLGDRATTTVAAIDDSWPIVPPAPHTKHEVGSLNSRASLTAACAPEIKSFFLSDPKIDRHLAYHPTLPTYGTSRGADLDLHLVERGVDLRNAQNSHGANLATPEAVTALLAGKTVLVLSGIHSASMGARPGFNPSVWDGSNVSLNFPEGAHRILIVGTPLISADPEIKKGISIVVEGRDGTVYTQTRNLSGTLRIHCGNGELRIEDSIEDGTRIKTHSILDAKLGHDPKVASRGEPQGAAVVEQVAAMLPFETKAEMRMSSLLRRSQETAGLLSLAEGQPSLFTASDKGLHRSGLAGMGDYTAFAGETIGGTRVTVMPTYLSAGNYHVSCEFKARIRGTELLAHAGIKASNIVSINQGAYISGSTLPTEIQQAHLGFRDPRTMLQFLQSLTEREGLRS